MGRYLLYISYIGTMYRGAQKSVANGIILDPDSVQGVLECALHASFNRRSLREIDNGTFIPPTVTLSSRTDSGVHALKSAVHVDIPSTNNAIYHPESILKVLNRYMAHCDHSIRVIGCIPVNNEFHARYKAISRTYLYRFMVPKKEDDHRIPILDKSMTFFVKDSNFDIEKVKAGLKHFQGTKNFKTFVTESNDRYQLKKVMVRKLMRFTVEETQPFVPFDYMAENFKYYCFICQARSFLYNQVRRMVGSLLALGCGKITEKELREMIEVPSRKSWNPKVEPAGPYGLYLIDVEYDEEELKRYKIDSENKIPLPLPKELS